VVVVGGKMMVELEVLAEALVLILLLGVLELLVHQYKDLKAEIMLAVE
jgi:hypothetical protein